MADNHVTEDASAGEDEGFTYLRPVYDAAAENFGDSVDQMDVTISSNGNPLDSLHTETKATEDVGREDMFVDCPDEIENSESHQSSEEKNDFQNYNNLENDQYNEADSGIKVQELMDEMELLRDKLEKSASENERLARENEVEKIRELESVLSVKDQEIDFLNAKVAELSESSNIARSNSQLYELQLDKDQHIEQITNRILASLSMVHDQAEPLDDGSLTEKISSVEKFVSCLVEKCNHLVFENDQLKGCLNEVGLFDLDTIDEKGHFVMPHDKILELKRKEENLNRSLRNFEDENRNMAEQLEKQRSTVENLNEEIRRLIAEVEQEKNKCANTKEKLSMAVTKGKALVQQRDSLKQLLSEKTSQSEKCSVELQETLNALEEKDDILKRCGEILSQSSEIEEFRPEDITENLVRLTDEIKSLKAISLQHHKVMNSLMSFDFPENLASSEVDARVEWLAESFYRFKDEAMRLHLEIDKIKEAAYGEIEHLGFSLAAEIQEKCYLQAELDDARKKFEAHERLQHERAEDREALNNEIDNLRTSLLSESREKMNLRSELDNLIDKYEGVVRKEFLVSSERDKIVNMLMEAFGLPYGDHEEVRLEHSDSATVIDNCFSKIKENICRVESSRVDEEIFESFKSRMYITDQEMSLYKLIIEEDIISDRARASCLSNELETKTRELSALKDENAVMQKSREKSEDRCALLKEKLSMAVKKGKGLVQDRENLKCALDEKNTENDRLKSELQVTLSRYSECQDQISKSTLDAERISVLESDLSTANERAEELEQFLAETNSILQRVMESIESVTTPTNLFFKDPVEKVIWIAGYLRESQSLTMEMEKELEIVKDALSVAEDSRSRLVNEKKEYEASKKVMEEELRKEREADSRKFDELSVSNRALEDSLSRAEDDISRLNDERDIAVENRILAEEQLQRLKEEFYTQITKLLDADKTIQSLEHALSQAQTSITLLHEENSKIQDGRADFEREMTKTREVVDSQLYEASVRIKSLEDALLDAENKIEDFVREKRTADEEIIALRAKLESYMEDLAGTRGSLESELLGQLSHLHLFLEDETLTSLLGRCFDRKFESLNSMDSILNEIADCFVEMDSDVLQNVPVVEDDSSLSNTLPSNPDTAFDMEMLNGKVNADDSENLMFQIEKINERFHLKIKTVADKFDNLSTLMDASVAALLKRLQSTKVKIRSITEHSRFLKQQVMNITADKQKQEETVASLELENRTLLSACDDVIRGLESNVRKGVSELRSIHDFAKLDGKIMFMDLGDEESDTDHVKTVDKLLLATRRNEDLNKLFHDAINKLIIIREDMRNKMKETQMAFDQVLEEKNIYEAKIVKFDEVLEERDIFRGKILKLETDLKGNKNLCDEMMIKLAEYEKKEDEWTKKESELSASLSKLHEYEDSLLSASQVKLILDKVNEVEITDDEFRIGGSHALDTVRKLFCIIDSYNESLKKVSLMSRENEELQSTIDQQILENELLRRQVENHMDNVKDLEKMKELLELESGLQNFVRNLVGGDVIDDNRVDVLPLLAKFVMARMHESESLKSRNEELGAKLLRTQKAVDDLSNKVKFLNDSSEARIVKPEIDHERGTLMASLSTQSEITEMPDMEALGTNHAIPPVQSAAHARTLRKGSNDHLAISIDSESERLIKNKESVEDKGHVFKSLNNSGLIPRQGRTVADRIDGIWVSGSRALMSHPRGRLGLIAYWLVLHIWLIGAIL